MSNIVLKAEHVSKSFGRGSHRHEVLHDVSVTVRSGQCVAVIGQSGSGKSTLTRIMFGLEKADEGSITFRGQQVNAQRDGRDGLRALRAASGVVYQNPFESLDPRWTAGRSVAEPLVLANPHMPRERVAEQVRHSFTTVALDPQTFLRRYPMDMSGGQAQRVAIARALVTQPCVILADEPMSAIDVAARVQILGTLQQSRQENPDMAMVVVSHDLGVVQHLADRIVVMHAGRVVERGDTEQILHHPQHPYTESLIEAASW